MTVFNDYNQRFTILEEEIKLAFVKIYGEELYHKFFPQLTVTLSEANQKRSKALKKLDQERSGHNWWQSQDMIGMMLYADQFAGDIKGVTKKLDYLNDLGVKWLHLMPVLDMPEQNNDGGYAVRDYQKVAKKFGSMKELNQMAKKMHDKEMYLMLDLVLNHTADTHEWAIKAQQGDQYYQDFFYTYNHEGEFGNLAAHMPDVFPQSAPGSFSFHEEMGKWVMTVFHRYQWDLNYKNPVVFIEMLKNLLFLFNQGIDILRLDAVPFLWKQEGTTCQNLPEAHDLLHLFKLCTSVVAPGTALVSEAIVAPEEIVKYLGTEDRKQCDIGYNASMMALAWEALATQSTSMMNNVLRKTPSKNKNATWINYLRCHDDIGFGFSDEDIQAEGKNPKAHRNYIEEYFTGEFPTSTAKGERFMPDPVTGYARMSGSLAALTGLQAAEELNNEKLKTIALDKLKMLYALVYAYEGTPMLYYGDEIGSPNDTTYLSNPSKSYDNRWMHRPTMDWDRAKLVNKKGTIPFEIYAYLKHIGTLRSSFSEFSDQENSSILATNNQHIFSFLRWNENMERTLVISNFSGEIQKIHQSFFQQIDFNTEEIKDAIEDKSLSFDKEYLLIAPYQTVWVQQK